MFCVQAAGTHQQPVPPEREVIMHNHVVQRRERNRDPEARTDARTRGQTLCAGQTGSERASEPASQRARSPQREESAMANPREIREGLRERESQRAKGYAAYMKSIRSHKSYLYTGESTRVAAAAKSASPYGTSPRTAPRRELPKIRRRRSSVGNSETRVLVRFVNGCVRVRAGCACVRVCVYICVRASLHRQMRAVFHT